VRSLKVIGFIPENILITSVAVQFVYLKESAVGIGFLFFLDMTPRNSITRTEALATSLGISSNPLGL